MSGKADRTELEAVIEQKSNKIDTDLVMKGLDIVHKQITHVVVLLIEVVKAGMAQVASDSERTKHHKNQMFIL